MSRGDYVLLLNPDTIVPPEALVTVRQFMEERKDVGIVGCRLVSPSGVVETSCQDSPNLWALWSEMSLFYKLFPRSRVFGGPYLHYFGYDKTREVDIVKGAFLLMRRSAVEQVGLLDEGFFMYSEEVDWCHRAKTKGWKACFFPGVEVVHYGGQSTSSDTDRMFVHCQRSRLRFFRKHHSPAAARFAKLLLFWGTGLRALIWLTSILSGKGTSKARARMYVRALRWFLTEERQSCW
jgi:GT2 family glycosyltransferase